MKQIRKLSISAVFVLVLSASAFAGEMDTPKGPVSEPLPPPPPPAIKTEDDPLTGTDSSSVLDTLTEATLNIMQSLLNLF